MFSPKTHSEYGKSTGRHERTLTCAGTAWEVELGTRHHLRFSALGPCQFLLPRHKHIFHFTFQQAAATPSHSMAQATQRRAGKYKKLWHKQMLFQCSKSKDVGSKLRLNTNIFEKF